MDIQLQKSMLKMLWSLSYIIIKICACASDFDKNNIILAKKLNWKEFIILDSITNYKKRNKVKFFIYH